MLRKILSILLVFLVTAGMFVQDADARRFGGGRSFGISRSSAQASPFSQRSFASQATRPTNRWLGPLAGLAVGGLIASLFMGHGIGTGILSWLLVAGLFFALLSFLRQRMQPRPVYRQDYHQNHFARENMAAFSRPQPSRDAAIHPMGFDAASFLREAKAQFIRLQAAYDQKNLNDIREFTSPEVFAEIQLQFQERGIAENKTDVLSLEAELLNVETQAQQVSSVEMQTLIASVRFNGMIQEDRQLSAESVSEIWHFKKEVGNLRWIVAGVQQV